jgi:hypothetical protein
MFDPELFGQAMGEAILKAVAPLHAEIASLKAQLAALPTPANGADGQDGAPGRDGKDCDMEAVQAMVVAAVKALPAPKDGANGQDGRSVTLEDLRPLVDSAVKSIRNEAAETVAAAVKALPVPKDGKDGDRGPKGDPGQDGADGADGIGLAGAMIDRAGELLVTLTNGTVKSLGAVVGKDGKDGIDGISLDTFEMEYLEETHEVRIKAACAGRTKEVRYPAGGLRPQGYWREGTKAKACEAWVHDGSLWIAAKDTEGKPQAQGDDWVIAARKGRDGQSIVKTIPAGPPAPIKLGA